MNRKKILQNFFKTRMFEDVFLIIPVYTILVAENGSQFNQTMSNWQRALLSIRVLRFKKLSQFVTMLEERIVGDFANLILEFLVDIFRTIALTHQFACIFIYLAQRENQDESVRTWVDDANLTKVDNQELYTNSLYWIFTTMTSVGYGDIKPQNTDEILMTMGCMIIAVGNFSLFLNHISKTISTYNHDINDYNENLHFVIQYMKEKKFPKEL